MAGQDPVYDLLIVGGGINGAGIACDAAGRGLEVALCEQADLAQATSSASSKLIHGGLRYLEFYQFRLVRESLAEREVLLAKAPHLIRPLRFVLPHLGVRPAWFVRLGLFLYDHLGPHPNLPGCSGLDLRTDPAGAPLEPSLTTGFAYSDCAVDDARLVVVNAMAAAARGAHVMTRTRLVGARRQDGLWQADLEVDGARRSLRARVLVNAAGPWVERVLGDALGDAARGPHGLAVRLVKGSHMVVPRLYDGDHAYILQNHDRRVVFVLPFEGSFSLIGTTEMPFAGDPSKAAMGTDEAAYLCAAVGRYFRKRVRPEDAVWSFAGVRPLFGGPGEEAIALTRDYSLELDAPHDAPALLSVFGGKITTYRRLAGQVLDRLRPFLPNMGPAWTDRAPLPGGDIAVGGFEAFAWDLADAYPGIAPASLGAIARRHGSLSRSVLGDARRTADLGADFGAGLHAREVDYLMRHEWAQCADDVLWRRTKCGLHLDVAARRAVAAYMEGDRRVAVGAGE